MRFITLIAALAGFVWSSVAFAVCRPAKLEFPITMAGLRPLIPIKLNGQDANILVDTGSFWGWLTPAAAARYGLKNTEPLPDWLRVGGINGEANASVVTVENFGIANATLHRVQFILGSGGLGGESVGLLGRNVLENFDIELDLANGAMRFWKFPGCPVREDRVVWAAKDTLYSMLPLENGAGRLGPAVTNILINGHKVRALLDTGASTSYLLLGAARRIGLSVTAPGVVSGGGSTGLGRRIERTWIVPVDSIEIGGEKMLRTKLRVGEGEIGEADMLLGDDFFLSNRVLIAFSQDRVYFSYNGGRLFNLAPLGDGAETPPARAPAVAAVSPDPGDAAGFARRGAALLARGDIDPALADFDKAIALDPKNARLLYQRAEVRQRKRQTFLAMDDLNAALKLKPDDPEILLLRARFKLGGQDRDGAKADLDAAANAAPEQADYKLAIGEMYDALDEPKLAVAQLGQWIQYHREDAELPIGLNNRCWARALANVELDSALADCNTAARRIRDNAFVLDSRGLVHLRRGEYDAAIADYTASLARNPVSAWSLYGRGVAKLKKGMKAEGEADIAAAAKIAPKLPERAKKLGIVA